MNKDFLLQSYTFDLPEERIAQTPAQERDSSRLLVYSLADKTIKDARFSDLLNYLDIQGFAQKPLFIANNSKVLPARLLGRSPHGGKRELLLLTPLPILEIRTQGDKKYCIAEVLLKPSKLANINDIWGFDGGLSVKILEKFDYGNTKVEFSWTGELADIFNTYGHLPLPPYIKRAKESLNTDEKAQEELDKIRYQTTYADDSKLGSVAAPTAGLHFTPELRKKLLDLGCQWEEVTLHVGYGTFTPVRTDDIREHGMHAEYFELSAKTAQAILNAKALGRPIIAVGTTSCRVLEGAYRLYQSQSDSSSLLPSTGIQGATDIFIYPDAQKAHNKPEFQIIDGMITNFHLPESSLLMLVSALVGRKEILEVYKHAIAHEYRFFSYGDAMFIS